MTTALPRRSTLRVGALAIVLVAGSLLAGCGSDSDSASTASTTVAKATSTTSSDAVTTTTAAEEVVKDILGQDEDPPGADGRTLTLIRYTIPPGAKLAPHIHPGVQLAAIVSGKLTYTVESGTAVVRRKGATTDEDVTGPATTTLNPGDSVTEVDGMVHFGANDTDEPVIIEATLLTTDGADLAVPITTTTVAKTPGY